MKNELKNEKCDSVHFLLLLFILEAQIDSCIEDGNQIAGEHKCNNIHRFNKHGLIGEVI